MKGVLAALIIVGLVALNVHMRRDRPLPAATRPSNIANGTSNAEATATPSAAPEAKSAPPASASAGVSGTAWTWKRGAAISAPLSLERERLLQSYNALLRLRKRAEAYRDFQAKRIALLKEVSDVERLRASQGKTSPAEQHYQNLRKALSEVVSMLRECED